MNSWREPIKPKVSVTPTSGYLDPTRKTYREHTYDEVLFGWEDRLGFHPQHRLRRHFIDGKLVDTERAPLKPHDPRHIEPGLVKVHYTNIEPEESKLHGKDKI